MYTSYCLVGGYPHILTGPRDGVVHLTSVSIGEQARQIELPGVTASHVALPALFAIPLGTGLLRDHELRQLAENSPELNYMISMLLGAINPRSNELASTPQEFCFSVMDSEMVMGVTEGFKSFHPLYNPPVPTVLSLNEINAFSGQPTLMLPSRSIDALTFTSLFHDDSPFRRAAVGDELHVAYPQVQPYPVAAPVCLRERHL